MCNDDMNQMQVEQAIYKDEDKQGEFIEGYLLRYDTATKPHMAYYFRK